MGGDAGDGAPTTALATASLSRSSPFLLPGGGGRDGDMADGSSTQRRAAGAGYPGVAHARQRRGKPEAATNCAETSDGRRQDDGHGPVDRMADDQRRTPSPEPTLY